jgi:NAD+ kinase
MTKRYGQTAEVADADVIVSLGGDGQTLHALQDGIRLKKPVFGLNFGRIGFLQNLHKRDKDLIDRIAASEPIELSPLRVEANFLNGDIRTDFAINEVHICNHNRASITYLRVFIDGRQRIDRMGGDGLIVSTTAGSTSYNKSANGPILPLGDDMIVLTPNNPFTPNGMRPSVIRPALVEVEVIDPEFRSADIYADSHAVGEGCVRTSIGLDRTNRYRLLFDPGYSLHEKIMRTQFSVPGVR